MAFNAFMALKNSIVVGLCADRIHGYTGGRCKGKAKDAPLELIQLCVGSHCLLYYLEPVNNYSYKKRSIHKLLKDFLYDSQITVVGVGIKEVVERLGKERGLFTKSWVELRELAGAEEKCSKGNNFSRPKLAALAKEPDGLIWWSEMYYDVLSNYVVMYATVEAFLPCRIGSKLLRCSCE
ncbi:hypothetical protein RGQ29_030959 [Quercus rubra]|uniref:Uncharacterized protein n=1 Tax=Quercus rubra TaxID=3512 RepID=A0AAN7EIX3_QUERU|nr:hypothetical protein RGQ29_030959 [Quercus rubra]